MVAQLNQLNNEVKHINNEVKHINSYLESSSGQKWYVSRKGHIRVLITPTLFSLRDVDTVKQEFSAELWYEIFYKDQTLKGTKNRDDVDWDNQWDPRIVLRNTTSIETVSSAQNLIPVVGEDVPIVHEFRKVRATFKVDMDLTDFPVDHQELTVQLMSGWPIKKADLRKNYGSNDTITDEDFADKDQWTVSKFLECKHDKKTNIQSETFGEYPVYNITAHVQRKSSFYLWNTVLILFIIIALSFTVFSIPLEDHKDRLGITFTLLLTTVAFKLVVSQYLPTVSYLTLLDKYVLGCVIFQCVVAVQNTVASVIRDKEHARLFDGVCVGLFGAAVLLAHLVIGIYVWMKRKENSRKLQEVDKKFGGLKEQVDKAYDERDKNAPGSTKTNMIIKGFTAEEVRGFKPNYESDSENTPLV
ncbi:PREDICTED: neuronal acetylcholine receptor subunit alpha-9-I-like [Branchiostoma belcheri]|uniref:Neuronal acetylcholine receptor subunit alpha-9-I-like n=1 Tax=Branchiostoma belcheri TaxID=7741 RepID=A0A6P4ZSA4_BRABE|nr:PREDICTED: neuronal acetylcholine receptor subunit alpha-9-I-like [Branchiostoma belcheri]